ncbi:MAG: type II 3-dehydroquinate dehydratase [Neisseriaceae bacterium]
MNKHNSGKALVLHGPNINMLGSREPEIYGRTALKDIDDNLKKIGKLHNIMVECFQSNSEGELITKTQSAITILYDFIIVNPAGYTHTSIAWRDAFLAVKIPFIEIHLSNIFSRENFRHKSFFSDIAVAVISGLGTDGYELALNYAIRQISNKE